MRAELSKCLRLAAVLATSALLAHPGVPAVSGSTLVLRPACSPTALSAAIQRANSTREADTIVLKAGCTYTLTRVAARTDDGPSGLPIITTPITLRGSGATIARASSAPLFRLIGIDGARASLKVDHLTLRGGRLPVGPTDEPAFGGGAIYVRSGSLEVSASTFIGNTAGRGSDHLTSGADGTQGGGGGAIATQNGRLAVTTSTFRANAGGPGGRGGRAGGPGGNGGAILSDYSKPATITKSTFIGNVSGAGGQGSLAGGGGGRGGAVFGGTANVGAVSLTIVDSRFISNRTGTPANNWPADDPYSIGGAVAAWGPLFVRNSTFGTNAAFKGGAIWASADEYNGASAISGSTFVRNTAEHGGAAIISLNGTLAVTNTTITANRDGSAGALLSWNGTLFVTNSTIVDNISTDSPAGIVAGQSTATIRNSIIAGNHREVPDGNPGQNCTDEPGAMVDGGGNVRWPASDPTCYGTHGDPKLLGLADNGGSVETMDLGSGSAALDAGLDAVCMAPVGSVGQGAGGVDQRGISRAKGTHCDVGAVEHVALDHLVLAPTNATVDFGESQAYTADGRGSGNEDLGDRASLAVYSIAPDGTCTGRTCVAAIPGDHVVTATVGPATGTATLHVKRLQQSISFPQPTNAALAESPRTVTAKATSELPVSFSSTTPTVCASGGANGASITLLRAGTCTVIARQAGDTFYDPAPPVTRSFTVH